MPYEIKFGKGSKPYKIIEKATGKQVGESDSKEKAERSINYRIAGDNAKVNVQRR